MSNRTKLSVHDKYDANRLRTRAPFTVIMLPTPTIHAVHKVVLRTFTHGVIDRNGDTWAHFESKAQADAVVERLNLKAARYIMTEG